MVLVHFLMKQVTKTDVLTLLEKVPKLQKSLKHLVVLTNTDVHSTSDLAKLVIWSLIVGVPYVSFYDITGNLKTKEKDLFFEIEKNKKGIPGCIKWSNKRQLNGYTYGVQGNTVYINIFSYSDGKPKIVNCVKDIAEDKLFCERSSDEFTANEFDEALRKHYPNIPEPELVLYTGPLCCTNGLLPWQIRLSEFVQISYNNNINVNNFLGALNKYCKCDQRFGK
ncbi:dehydrodolichyl diphosphate synthase complex subunit Nus1 isoform X2 [Danaus plexippus]|uniref:dehydrodolichyl diphosphate synthase complex subunit Nus1 isoform X2 n=1 Tax=Danaus plexippus TaxID=13037 RepID=UPI0013C4F600|nr:dehydrodolichyl diphosphate synthase complex subunit Nus1 isoform X2 [Danaus plexippus]